MAWVKIPALADFCQTCENVILRATMLRSRFRTQEVSRWMFPGLQTILTQLYLTDTYGDYLWREASEANDYRAEHRARLKPEFRKLFRIDVNSEKLELISAPDGLE